MKKNIISFYELEEQWQAEAKRNLEEYAEEMYYLEPEESQSPEKHALIDLGECMPHEGIYDPLNEAFKYNGVISWSNNSAILLLIDEGFETAEVKFI